MEINFSWEKLTAEERIERAVDVTGAEVMATSSFGIQSAVLLHLIHRVYPKMPIVFIDTGFLFDETYQYAERLVKMWGLDLHTYKAERNDSVESESGETVDLEEYNSIHKVEPLYRALNELSPKCWISGVRRVQSSTRRDKPISEEDFGLVKLYPIIDWTDKDVFLYQQRHELPEHPLWKEGYVTVGDRHLSDKLKPGQAWEGTRFGGVVRECGLHTNKEKELES